MRALTLIPLLLMVQTLEAKTISYYRCTADDGEMVLSDRPCGEDAENLNLTVKTAAPPDRLPEELFAVPKADNGTSTGLAGGSAVSDEPEAYYSYLKVLAPRNGEALRSQGGSVSVAISSNPGKRPEDKFQVLVDGKEMANSPLSRVTIDGLPSGRHSLSVRLVDGEGTTLLQTDAVYFILFGTPGE